MAEPSATATIDRRESRDRRSGADRRGQSLPVAVERRALQRRVKVNRRRQIDPTTCERDYTPDEIEFMGAMDEYKRRNGRMFPTCSEVLEVVKSLGYEKRPKIEAAALPALDLLPARPQVQRLSANIGLGSRALGLAAGRQHSPGAQVRLDASRNLAADPPSFPFLHLLLFHSTPNCSLSKTALVSAGGGRYPPASF